MFVPKLWKKFLEKKQTQGTFAFAPRYLTLSVPVPWVQQSIFRTAQLDNPHKDSHERETLRLHIVRQRIYH